VLLDGSVRLWCGVCGWCSVLWLLSAAGMEDRKRSRGLALFSLGFVCISSDFFEGRTEGVLCSHGFHGGALEGGQGKVGEGLFRTTNRPHENLLHTVSHTTTTYTLESYND
jgi:hypothetical protein